MSKEWNRAYRPLNWIVGCLLVLIVVGLVALGAWVF